MSMMRRACPGRGTIDLEPRTPFLSAGTCNDEAERDVGIRPSDRWRRHTHAPWRAGALRLAAILSLGGPGRPGRGVQLGIWQAEPGPGGRVSTRDARRQLGKRALGTGPCHAGRPDGDGLRTGRFASPREASAARHRLPGPRPCNRPGFLPGPLNRPSASYSRRLCASGCSGANRAGSRSSCGAWP